MCSITYIENGTEEEGRRINQVLAHRGPDSSGLVRTAGDVIGANRLAIVDLSGGDQPITTKDGRYTIAYNGEVYNHKTLKRNLERKGRRFRTNCDTEVVLNAVAEKGSEAPKDFDGQFAYVVKDSETGKVYAGRDHFGIRPLYYGIGRKGLVIASEIPGLLANAVLGGELRKLPQGCTLEYNLRKGKPEIRRYYDLRDHVRKEEVDPRKLFHLLDKAVRKRVPQEVDHATILSGIDSSTIAYFADRQKKKPKMTYTVATDPKALDVQSARAISKQLGIENKVLFVDEDFVIRHLDDVVRTMASPMFFPLINAFPTLRLAKEIKKDGIKVIMTGSGSDETNIGYDFLWEMFDPKYAEENALNLIQSVGENECFREDRVFGSQGREGRVPFLDKGLVECVLSTPFGERVPEMSRTKSKWQLRETMRGKIPDLIVEREKDNLYRSTGMMPLMTKVADRLMSDEVYAKYMTSLKGTGWENWVFGGKIAAIFHKRWAELYPELAAVPLADVTCGWQMTPNFDDLNMLSKYWVTAGGGINLKGWSGKTE